MIKYAVMTFMYNGWVEGENGSHEELITILGEAGADGIEAFANHFMGRNELVNLYRQKMADHALTMPVMDLLANLACVDRKERDEAYELMRRGIDICDGLDAEIVHVAGCCLPANITPEDGRKWIAEGLTDFVDDVEKRGMILAFEDFNPAPTLICSAADCLEILDLSDSRVKFVFDTGNFEVTGEHAEDNLPQLIEHICHFHFKDFQPAKDPTVCHGAHFGQGRIKNREIARAVTNYDYSGWVALETTLQDSDGPRKTITRELKSLKLMFDGNS